jgi:hypothetical protein
MNTATAITIAIVAALTPTVTCLIGIILSRQDIRDFRGEIRGEMGALRAEIRGEMTALRNMVHADMLLIHERVAKIEGKQTR